MASTAIKTNSAQGQIQAICGSPTEMNNEINKQLASRGVAVRSPHQLMTLTCCILAPTWPFTATPSRSNPVLTQEQKDSNTKTMREVVKHMRAMHSNDPSKNVKMPVTRGSNTPQSHLQLHAQSESHDTTAPAAAVPTAGDKRKRETSSAHSQSETTPPHKRRAGQQAIVMIDSVEWSQDAAEIDSEESRSETEAAADCGSDRGSDDSDSDSDSASNDDEEEDSAMVKQRKQAAFTLESSYRYFHEQRALLRDEQEDVSAPAVDPEWTDGKQQWCSCGCCGLWINNTYDNYDVYSGSENARIEQHPSTPAEQLAVHNLDAVIAAIFCPHSLLKGLVWEVKHASGYDADRLSVNSDEWPMDTDINRSRDVHTMTLIAQPLVAAFEWMCEALGYDRDDDVRDKYLDHPPACNAAAVQRLEDLVTKQLLSRWQTQEQGVETVATTLSMLVAMFNRSAERFLPRHFEACSPAHNAVAQLLCTALKRAMAQPLGDGHWFDLTCSPRLLILAIQAIQPQEGHACLLRTAHREAWDVPERCYISSCGPSGKGGGGKGGRGKFASFSRFSLCSVPSVRCALLPVLLGAPPTFWPCYVSKSWADQLAEDLFHDGLLHVGEMLSQSPSTTLHLSLEEQFAAELTARLVACISRVFSPKACWTLDADGTQAFSKIAATVPGVGIVMRGLVVLKPKS